MPQHGADTVIGPETRLLIIDCFETLVSLVGPVYQPRNGVPEFLKHFGLRTGLTLVVHSDGARTAVERALDEAAIRTFFAALYHADEAIEVLPDGRCRKRLDLPLRDLGLTPSEAIFIGDSPMDAESAEYHGVRFIRVPRSEDEQFSFTQLIVGPSKYNSGVFRAQFLKRYTGD